MAYISGGKTIHGTPAWVGKPQLPPVIPTDKDLMDWKTLDELAMSKIESKRRKDLTSDLTWKDVVRIPSCFTLEGGAKLTKRLKYEYFSYENHIYKESDTMTEDTGLLDEDVNEIL